MRARSARFINPPHIEVIRGGVPGMAQAGMTNDPGRSPRRSHELFGMGSRASLAAVAVWAFTVLVAAKESARADENPSPEAAPSTSAPVEAAAPAGGGSVAAPEIVPTPAPPPPPPAPPGPPAYDPKAFSAGAWIRIGGRI